MVIVVGDLTSNRELSKQMMNKDEFLIKWEKVKSELTELKARDTSCPRGKKVELRKIITIGIDRAESEGYFLSEGQEGGAKNN